jgi:ABC-type multidrug transport system ATPase subunit
MLPTSHGPWTPGNLSSGDLAIASGSYAAASMDLEGINATNYVMHLSYNYTLTDVLPVVLNLWSNALLAAATNASENHSSTGSIFTSFYPLPPLTVTTMPTVGDFVTSTLLGFYAALGFITIPAIQAFNAVKDRQIKTKQLQLLMGATPLVYWTAVWCWDVAQYSIPWLGGLAIIFGASHTSYQTTSQYAAVCILLALFGISMPLLTYILSFRFSDAAEAQKVSRVSFSVLLVLLFASTFVLDFPALTGGSSGLHVLSEVVSYVGMLYPPYALAKGYSDTITLGSCSAAVLAAGLPCEPQNAFSWDLAGAKIFFMVISCPVGILLVLRAERNSSPRPVPAVASAGTDTTAVIEDDDVVLERRKVETVSAEGLVARHLQKRYDVSHGDSKLAVRDLCLHVPRGEVLGLLGPNGAGKTTTLSMLVTDVPPTSGEAFIDGINSFTVRQQGLDLIGYCPQFDSLFDFMTGRETLQFFAALNGVPAANLHVHVDAALRSLDLTSHADVYSSKYSGGNKRRLSLAIAYMGNASVVFLDECSTGVDPFARQRMFDVIRRAQANRTTIMTTHVMEEADGLCTKIGIMVDGSLACIGSPQHLKTKYGRGYLIEMLLLPGSFGVNVVEELSTLLQTCSEGVRLLERSGSHLRFEVTSIRLPAAFRNLEKSRERLGIADYNISQTTLEAVFLSFSRIQENINQASAAVAASKGRSKRRRRQMDASNGS